MLKLFETVKVLHLEPTDICQAACPLCAREIDFNFDKKQTGMFVWAEVSKDIKNGEYLSDLILKNANVFITPGFIFGSNGNKYIRISLCSEESVLTEAKNRIENIKIK